MNHLTFLSRCLLPGTSILPAQSVVDSCISQKLLSSYGLTWPSSLPGGPILHPFAVRSLDKLINLVQTVMLSLGAQKLVLPLLGSQSLWSKSGRWDLMQKELFRLTDRSGKNYCLQPTHEEEVTAFIARQSIGVNHLPIRLFQIGQKFRDELHYKHGLLRAREFTMKDLYTFDSSPESAQQTYESVCQSYDHLFSHLGLSVIKVCADSGEMGGSLSHEYHLKASVGEDILLQCVDCRTTQSPLPSIESSSVGLLKCPNCKSDKPLESVRSIEIAHCFLLGQRYSKPFDASFQSPQGRFLLEMGCFGIGITRLLAASIESLASSPSKAKADSTELLRWPSGLAPFSGAVLLQKSSAKDALIQIDNDSMLQSLAPSTTCSPHLPGDILVDDRLGMSLGRKLVDAQRLGLPWIAIAKRPSPSRPDRYELIQNLGSTPTTRSFEARIEQIRTAFYQPSKLDVNQMTKWTPTR